MESDNGEIPDNDKILSILFEKYPEHKNCKIVMEPIVRQRIDFWCETHSTKDGILHLFLAWDEIERGLQDNNGN